MLKKVSLEQLSQVSGGYTMEQLAGVNHRVGRAEGLNYARYAYAHARSQGMSARQFNCMGWRAYAASAARSRSTTTHTVTTPGGPGVAPGAAHRPLRSYAMPE